MVYGSVCSGIEAATCAWHGLGWTPAFFAEIDKAPASFLARKYPDVPNHGDMTKFKDWPDHAIDLLVGGTPCQSFSVAGLRKGMADPRGNLALVFLALADRYRPQWIVWENVPGVLSSNGGRDFGSFLGGLGQLGYGFAYRVLDAQYVRVESHPRAVPQRRRRVFVVGCLGDWRRAAAVLFERESLSGHPPPRREAGKGTARGIEIGPSGGGYADVNPTLDARAKDGPIRNQIAGAAMVPAVCGTLSESGGHARPDDNMQSISQGYLIPAVGNPLTARMHKGVNTTLDEGHTLVAHSLKAEGFDASEDGTGRGTPIVPVVAGTMKSMRESDGFSNSVDHAAAGYMVPIAIQGAATRENPASGPDGIGVRQDGAAYTLEARQEVQAIAFDTKGSQVQTDESGATPTLRSMAHDGSHQNGGGQLGVMTLAIRGRGDSHNLEYREDGTANAVLTPNGGRGGIGVGAVAFAQNQRDEIREMSAAGALAAEPGMKQQTYLATTMAVRRLTPLECTRLQGFPDDYFDLPGKPFADGPIYKMLGNSMAVNCMTWIGQRIDHVQRMAA